MYLTPLSLHEPLRVKHCKFNNEKEFRVVFNLTKYSVLTGFEFEGNDLHVGRLLSHHNPNIIACMSEKGAEQSSKVIRRKNSGLVLDFDFGCAIHEVRVHPLATDEELLVVRKRLSSIGVRGLVTHSQLRGQGK